MTGFLRGQPINHDTPHNASRLIMSVSFDERDAILGLADWTQKKLSVVEIAQLRGDVAQLREQIEELTRLVKTRLGVS